MAQSLQVTILKPRPKGTGWEKEEREIDLKEFYTLPEICYIFLGKNDFNDREELLKYFKIPVFIANTACTELNGYFGCRPTYHDDKDEVTACSTWFRCLVKMVRQVKEASREEEPEYVTGKSEKKGYKWFEMGIYTLWEGRERSKVLCVDTPHDLPKKLALALGGQPGLDFQDPFAMHTNLLDQILVYGDISVWRVRDPVRSFEKERNRLQGNVFESMHDNSRHAIHASEVLEATIETMTELQRYQTEIHKSIPGLKRTYKERAKAYTDFQIQFMKCLKLRSDSNLKRLETEVKLAFNNLAQQDSKIMKQDNAIMKEDSKIMIQDSKIMRSIAFLTMFFLPGTFVSALFSTTFFSFGESGWQSSNRLWIYWAVALPATVVVLVVWNVWMARSRTLNISRAGSWDA